MNTRTAAPSPIETALHAAVGQLVTRATAAPAEATGAAGARTPWLRWLLALAALFVAWRAWRGFRSLFWTVFGLAMAVFWSGAWHRMF